MRGRGRIRAVKTSTRDAATRLPVREFLERQREIRLARLRGGTGIVDLRVERSSGGAGRSKGAPAAIAIAVACALFGIGSQARAQPAKAAVTRAPAEISGTVLGIDEADLILDLGSDHGLTPGAKVEIWRPLKLTHPITGKVFTDRFRIGTLEIGQIRKSVSLASPSGELTRAPQKGDVIIVPAPKAPAPAPAGSSGPPAESKPAPSPPALEEADVRAIQALLEGLSGADLPTHIRRYEEFVRRWPNSRFTRTLLEQLAALRQLAKTGREEREPAPATLSFSGPKEAVTATPLRVGIELTEAATGAVLHVRGRGEPSYRSFPMTVEGNGYFGATIPAERMTLPAIQYFIEATSAAGRAFPVAGAANQPREVDVLPIPRAAAPAAIQTRVAILTDYADYNRFRNNDRAWVTEGTFEMRFGDTGVRALRSGFGVYRGIGGTVEELDTLGLSGRPIGLTYGYLETEIGVVASFAIVGRLAVGLLDDGIEGGGQLLFRIGNDLRTNLLLGGELLGGVGLKSIAQLELNVFPRFPIVLRSEVTNQPAGTAASAEVDAGVAQGRAEVGVRAIGQVGMRIIPALTVSIRGSFQGRNIRHAGPGFGAGVSYTW
jgi:hypothetical protein